MSQKGGEKSVGGEGTLQDMYEGSEKDRLGCHGRPVEISRYRLRKVVTRSLVSLSLVPKWDPCPPHTPPCTRKFSDPASPMSASAQGGGGETEGRWRRWSAAFTPLVCEERPTQHPKGVGVRRELGKGRAGQKVSSYPGVCSVSTLARMGWARHCRVAGVHATGYLVSPRELCAPSRPTHAGVEGAASDPAPSSAHSRGFEHRICAHCSRYDLGGPYSVKISRCLHGVLFSPNCLSATTLRPAFPASHMVVRFARTGGGLGKWSFRS